MSINRFLRQMAAGDNLRDYDHASRTFTANTSELQPRYKHLFHVSFVFDPAIRGIMDDVTWQDRNEIHLLVKSIDLPGFTFDVEEHNQYNRKRYSQHKINYDPINIRFHDDQKDLIRRLWNNYYTYYYQDSEYLGNNGDLPAAYDPTSVYSEHNPRASQWGYQRGPKATDGKQFFKEIRIYTMWQKRFSEHVLVNPIITNFRHDNLAYEESGILEHNMTVQYETVKYATGFVNENNPRGFAATHYDTRPSPLTPLGGGTNSVFFRGGLVDTSNSVLQDLSEGNILGAVLKGNVLLNNARDMDIQQVLSGEVLGAGRRILRGENPLSNVIFPQIPTEGVLGNILGSGNPGSVPGSETAASVFDAVTSQGQAIGAAIESSVESGVGSVREFLSDNGILSVPEESDPASPPRIDSFTTRDGL